MDTTATELDDFVRFVQMRRNGDKALSLEEAVRQFRAQQAVNSSEAPARTPLVEILDRLREEFIAQGGKLLTPDEVDEEVRSRRGSQFAEG